MPHTGVFEKSDAVVSRTSATQQDKLTEAERSSIWKPTSLIRGVAFATPLFAKKCPRWCQKVPLSSRLEGRWYELRPRKAGGGAFPSPAPLPR